MKFFDQFQQMKCILCNYIYTHSCSQSYIYNYMYLHLYNIFIILIYLLYITFIACLLLIKRSWYLCCTQNSKWLNNLMSYSGFLNWLLESDMFYMQLQRCNWIKVEIVINMISLTIGNIFQPDKHFYFLVCHLGFSFL